MTKFLFIAEHANSLKNEGHPSNIKKFSTSQKHTASTL